MHADPGSRPKVTVIIPALNEARNLSRVLPRLPRDLHEVIVVSAGLLPAPVLA